MNMGSSGMGGGGGVSAGYQPQVVFSDEGLTIAGQGESAEDIPAIPLDADGCVDLNGLVSTLSEQTGIPEDVIAKEYLPGIVDQIEAHGEYKLRGLELLKDMHTDRMTSDGEIKTLSTGPTSVTEGSSEVTDKMLVSFKKEGLYVNPNNVPPKNDGLTLALKNDIKNMEIKLDQTNEEVKKQNVKLESGGPEMDGTVPTGDEAASLDGLTQTFNASGFSDEFIARLEGHMQSFPNGDVMASLFYVFRESIEQTNEDKRYFLGKLADMNKIAEAMGDYLKYLNDKSMELEQDTVADMKSKGKDFRAGENTVSITEQEFDTSTLDSDGKAISTSFERSGDSAVNNTGLGAAIKKLETDMETVRNKRQEFQTMFENCDQKVNQLFQILSTVLKSMKEMKSSVTRNML